MKGNKKIPLINICSLQKEEDKDNDDIIIEPFAAYLERHPNLLIPHRHSFYHIVLFTSGKGFHTIDFEQFPVKKGQIYFMIPGQVHSWQFKKDVDGYVLNFSEAFISSLLRNDQYAEQFPFLEGIAGNAVINLSPAAAKEAMALLRAILTEDQQKESLFKDLQKLKLLELFILINRNIVKPTTEPAARNNDLMIRNFRKLVAQYYTTLKLPKEYAALLYITPNHLNALCNDLLGKPAGEVIRDRILLEAKRLLINADMSISEIAWRLNFADNSYFTKFFKKQTGITPEAFRKSILEQIQK
jgi:AraC-like DNA-binding protein/mannose-6-phosphate isomerase-like protein (cupin superfamily)